MKNRLVSLKLAPAQRLIASFGEARLYVFWDGRLELQGGTKEDHTAAKEWISLFMHEAVPRHCSKPYA